MVADGGGDFPVKLIRILTPEEFCHLLNGIMRQMECTICCEYSRIKINGEEAWCALREAIENNKTKDTEE